MDVITNSRRQKKKGMSWSDDGSFALSALSRVFENDAGEAFFRDGAYPLSLRDTASGREDGGGGRRTGLEWMLCEEVQLAVRREMDEAEAA